MVTLAAPRVSDVLLVDNVPVAASAELRVNVAVSGTEMLAHVTPVVFSVQEDSINNMVALEYMETVPLAGVNASVLVPNERLL